MAATARPMRAPRTGSRRAGLARGLVAVLALLVAAGGAVALIAPALGRSVLASAGQAGPHAALPVLLAGASLIGAGALAWFGRPDRGLALIALMAAAAWLALELEASASVVREARTLGRFLAPVFVPLVIHLPIRAFGSDRRGGSAATALAVLYGVTILAATGRALTYDPFFDVHCSPICTRGDNVLLLAQDARSAASFETLGESAAILGGIGLAIWAVARSARARTRAWPELAVLLSAAAVGLTVAWWSGALLVTDPELPTRTPLIEPAVAAAIAVTALGAAVAGLVATEMRRAEALRRIADALAAGAGSASLRAMLSRTLRDERLRVAYPMGDGSLIDESGAPLDGPFPEHGRAVTAIERGGSRVALVEHVAGLDPDLLAREIGAAARLAVDNERLEATIRSRLRELQASRARIVEVGDAARGRLERDLHDGAQQRLLAVSFELRLAAASLSKGPGTNLLAAVERDIEELDRALAELRDLAHGIHPVVLTEDGLTGALATLAEDAEIAVEVTGDVGRCPAATELAAYISVMEGLRRVTESGADRLDVTVRVEGGELRLELAGHGLSEGPWVRIEDRVGAAGGQVIVQGDRFSTSSVGIVLPCA